MSDETRMIDNLQMIWTIAEDPITPDDLCLGLKEIFSVGAKQLSDEGQRELQAQMESGGA